MRPRSVALVVILALGAMVVAAIEPLRRWLVVAYTPEYRPAAAASARAAPRGVRPVAVASGLAQPTDLQFVPGGGGLAIVLEKGGKARLLDLTPSGEGSVRAPGATVLELAVRTDSELGLLGLAFHPRYAENGLFYVNSTPEGGEVRTRIAEWRLPRAELGKRRAADERVLLEVRQPYQNHNGGQLAFGPDGFLYIGLGDGGWRNDPHGYGQNLAVLLGKMLRIDVDSRSAGAYGIPGDNPFTGQKDARPEIWAYGLRNPWRYSFDPHGRLVLADVGQDAWEEIDLVARGDNLGWKFREGTRCFAPKEGCRSEGLVGPVFEYGREAGTSVTGGFVYTGTDVPELADHYVFGDFTSGRVWAMKLPGPHLTERGLRPARELGKWPFLISSFARDERGELYLLDYAEGAVHRLAAGRAR